MFNENFILHISTSSQICVVSLQMGSLLVRNYFLAPLQNMPILRMDSIKIYILLAYA